VTELSNPYQDEHGKPRIRTSLTAFLDILGFAEAIRKAASEGRQQAHLDILKAALDEAHNLFREDSALYERFSSVRVAPYLIKVFTDNIVLGIPIHSDGESELGHMLRLVGNYQFTLVQHGFFVRGGITVGDIYMDSDTAYGKALLDAYVAESTLARDPRVVLDSKAMQLVHQHLLYYDRVSTAPHNLDLLLDSDGQMFVNYLMIPLDGDRPDEAYLGLLQRHRQVIMDKLQEFVAYPQYWSKYMWSGIYHNVICADFLKEPAYLIPENVLRQPAQKLDQAYKKVRGSLFRGGFKVADFKDESGVRRLLQNEGG